MSPSTLLIALIFAVCSGHAQADNKDPFIPSSALSKVEVRYKADGRALWVLLKNASDLSLTAGKLVCDKYDTKLPKSRIASTGFPWCSEHVGASFISGTHKTCEYDRPYLGWFDETIKPGKTKELYFELEDYQVPVVRCEITDLRGRPAKFWE